MYTSKLIKLFTVALLLQSLIGFTAFAQGSGESRGSAGTITNSEKSGQFGLGLQVGGLAGLTLEYWNSARTAFNFSLIGAQNSWGLGVSHNWMFLNAFSSSDLGRSAFVPYIGAGMLVGFGRQWEYLNHYGNRTFLAAQVPLGVEFLPVSQRFGIFGEVAPSFALTPSTGGFLTADLGARFYF